jgi:acyl-CoA thioesterase-2
VLDVDDFALDGDDGQYQGTIGERWCFDGRAFGGFTASLALAAIARHTGRPVITSATVSFLEPGAPGPASIDVVTLRAGRTAAIARADIHQDGRPILTATAWLADAWTQPADVPAAPPFVHRLDPTDTTHAPAPLVPPEQGAPLDWLVEAWPMLGFAERRGVDYPESFLHFRDRAPAVALWLRLLHDDDPDQLAPSAWRSQLTDVLHLDAHLFDAPGQITGFVDPDQPDAGGVSMLSLDLAIAWQPGAANLPADAWRLLEARGSVVDRGVTSYGSLRAEDGTLIAMATSQGLIRRWP